MLLLSTVYFFRINIWKCIKNIYNQPVLSALEFSDKSAQSTYLRFCVPLVAANLHFCVLADNLFVVCRYSAKPDGILHCISADDYSHCDVHRWEIFASVYTLVTFVIFNLYLSSCLVLREMVSFVSVYYHTWPMSYTFSTSALGVLQMYKFTLFLPVTWFTE
jgi:hypothetical protein